MLSGLNHLQKYGIAHRDVRSDNILVNEQGIVKLGTLPAVFIMDCNHPF